MELKELLDIHEKIESRINAYWTYWSVAIFAIAGWLFADKDTLPLEHAIGISLAVMTFFFANLGVLLPATRLAMGIRDEIRLTTKDINFLSRNLTTEFARNTFSFRLQLTCFLHLAVDSVVLWAVFSI